jgi:hypothetical protein
MQTSLMVTQEHHPLRCGIPGKLYNKSDFVTPLCDVMHLLHSSAYGFGLSQLMQRARKSTAKDRNAVEGFGTTVTATFQPGAAALTAVRPAHKVSLQAPRADRTAGPYCISCKNSNPVKFTINNEGFRVCECGIVNGLDNYGVNFSETHSTNNNTARADAVCDSHEHRLDSSRNATSLSRRQKEVLQRSSVVPESVKRASRLGHATKVVAAAAELALPLMTKGQARKLTTVVDTINKLATQIAPVDESIVRQVRRTADRLFCRSVEHSRCCGKSSCHRSLFDKSARVIACKCFVYTIEKAANGDGIDGVSKQTLTALQFKINNSHVFNAHDNAAQSMSCIGILVALDSEDMTRPCGTMSTLVVPLKRKADSVDSVAGTSMKRQNSDLNPSPILQVRDAISKLSGEFAFGSGVRDKAIGALMNGNFGNAVRTNTIVPAAAGKYATAYVVLCAVTDASDGHMSPSFVAEHAERVGLETSQLDLMISSMRALLRMSKPITQCADDELY